MKQLLNLCSNEHGLSAAVFNRDYPFQHVPLLSSKTKVPEETLCQKG